MSITIKHFILDFDEGERAYLRREGEEVTITSFSIHSRGNDSYNVTYVCVGESGKEYTAYPYDLLNI